MNVRSELRQSDLFGRGSAWPEGFRYEPDLVTPMQEAALIEALRALPFEPFDFHGYKANREVVGYGWRYDYGRRDIGEAEPMPGFLLPLRERAAAFAGLEAEAFQQALINAYRPGAGVGWHRDKPHFGVVAGVSLGAPAALRFRRRRGEGWERKTVTVEPRSAYVMTAEARWVWEHSIAPVERQRWSITFRTLSAD
jgi:alkylated DNA repair dioxygenase AlkB